MINLKEALREITKEGKAFSKVCIVREVFPDSRTCTVEPVDAEGYDKDLGNPENYIYDIKYSPDVKVEVDTPEEGSLVYVQFFNSAEGFITQLSTTSKTVLGGGLLTVSKGSPVINTENKNSIFILTPEGTITDLPGQSGVVSVTPNGLVSADLPLNSFRTPQGALISNNKCNINLVAPPCGKILIGKSEERIVNEFNTSIVKRSEDLDAIETARLKEKKARLLYDIWRFPLFEEAGENQLEAIKNLPSLFKPADIDADPEIAEFYTEIIDNYRNYYTNLEAYSEYDNIGFAGKSLYLLSKYDLFFMEYLHNTIEPEDILLNDEVRNKFENLKKQGSLEEILVTDAIEGLLLLPTAALTQFTIIKSLREQLTNFMKDPNNAFWVYYYGGKEGTYEYMFQDIYRILSDPEVTYFKIANKVNLYFGGKGYEENWDKFLATPDNYPTSALYVGEEFRLSKVGGTVELTLNKIASELRDSIDTITNTIVTDFSNIRTELNAIESALLTLGGITVTPVFTNELDINKTTLIDNLNNIQKDIDELLSSKYISE